MLNICEIVCFIKKMQVLAHFIRFFSTDQDHIPMMLADPVSMKNELSICKQFQTKYTKGCYAAKKIS